MPATAATLLVVADDPALRVLYELTLLREGYRVETATSVSDAKERLEICLFDALITDMHLPDGLGAQLLHGLRTQQRSERCILIANPGAAGCATASEAQAQHPHAFACLSQPVDLQQLRTLMATAVRSMDCMAPPPALLPRPLHHSPGTDTGTAQQALQRLTGLSPAMQQLRQRIQKVAPGMAPVLIQGESGTGKELVARALHACSHRASGAWVAVNCGAIPEQLLEAEFFGVRKGAYTGATADRAGFFQAAHGGTLFLDEIGELPLSMQAKLLRAVQERRVRPLGALLEEAVDVRLVSATHRALAADVQAGLFRQDLYYRLNVIELQLAPLRERREDLQPLCQALLERMAAEQQTPVPAAQLPPSLLQQLQQHPLMGNVRELENLLHRAMALGEDLHCPGLPAPAATPPTAPALAAGTAAPRQGKAELPHPLPENLQAWLDDQERRILQHTLYLYGYNRSAAAARLGISLRQMRYRIARLHIPLVPEDAGHLAHGL
ncbi:sigma-54-dependent transcriptional regulator [Comamonas sp. GB3 AK4-5]|uniref:sigma-54-dependent transcriptional regulator n=1 Tax=Comamonas sp. GB3 AK4-5 TaxID=3231487 RepID=UPI00351F65BF